MSTQAYLIGAPLLEISEPVSVGTKIMLHAPFHFVEGWAVIDRKMGPSTIISDPKGTPYDFISGSGMTMAPAPICLLGHCIFRTMVRPSIPYKFDHHVAIEMLGIISTIAVSVQSTSAKEAFSLWVR